MSLFTPISGTIGGSLIGLSATVLLLGNGDVLGCSGIISSIFIKPLDTLRNPKSKWKLLFASAFLITSRIVSYFGQSPDILEMEQHIVLNSSNLPVVSTLGYCVAGFFVGFGTRLGNGCTTGHGICGMARLSIRSLVAVATFMSTGILSATMCSPMCKLAKQLRTDTEGLSQCYPTDASIFLSTMLIAILGGMSLPLLVQRSGKTENDDNVGIKKEELAEEISNDDKKGFVAIVSAALFSAGLFISGMTKNYKIYGFLDLKLLKKGTWDPTLIFVMGSGLLISAFGYHFVKGHNTFKNDEALSCPLLQNKSNGKFNVPTSQQIDKQLIVGSAFFGLGWGIAGLCPGPALFLAANGYPQIMFYWWPCNILGAHLGEKAKIFMK